MTAPTFSSISASIDAMSPGSACTVSKSSGR